MGSLSCDLSGLREEGDLLEVLVAGLPVLPLHRALLGDLWSGRGLGPDWRLCSVSSSEQTVVSSSVSDTSLSTR